MNLEQSQTLLSNPAAAAAVAGLQYITDDLTAGITRKKHKDRFVYVRPDNSILRDKATLHRIQALAIPPAWTSVWIAPTANAHLQATGRDARGRKQYRYNAEFEAVRDSAKFDHLLLFAAALPSVRARVRKDIAKQGTPREKVLAAVVYLLETTLIRIGNEDYARQNGSFGITTLRNRHVRVRGSELRFLFQGKSGKTWQTSLKSRRVAKIIRSLQDLPGQHLFQYIDDAGQVQKISSNDVNDYLRAASGRDITAKDFRTWAGTVEAAILLAAPDGDQATPKKRIRTALEVVSKHLGNTVTVCRKRYVHPVVLSAFEAGELALGYSRRTARNAASLTPEEKAVLAFLKRRLRSAQRTRG